MRAKHLQACRGQSGVMLIEALVAILIFSIGVLGLVALGGQAVGAQSDAQYRTEASGLAEAIASQIAVSVDRSANGANIAASLPAFSHRPGGAIAGCVFTGNATANAQLLALVNRAAALPGATGAQQQIVVDNAAGSFNRVEITLCWKTANDNAWRRHNYVTYINGGSI